MQGHPLAADFETTTPLRCVFESSSLLDWVILSASGRTHARRLSSLRPPAVFSRLLRFGWSRFAFSLEKCAPSLLAELVARGAYYRRRLRLMAGDAGFHFHGQYRTELVLRPDIAVTCSAADAVR